ncbi:hypothetical protein AD933_07785 [Acetobacter malorum]|uniref:Uncharacterized protein n=1 Tax=Acetobacter malorum TaxID=178901 RepID=A0A149RPF3_9PROT|nr:hypothetical protein AD933_07785 [Acetobacter malorum]
MQHGAAGWHVARQSGNLAADKSFKGASNSPKADHVPPLRQWQVHSGVRGFLVDNGLHFVNMVTNLSLYKGLSRFFFFP